MYVKLLAVSLMMAAGAAGLAVPDASNRTAKSVSVYVLNPVRYAPYDDRIEPQFSLYDQPIDYASYGKQFVSPPDAHYQREVQADAIASQIRKFQSIMNDKLIRLLEIYFSYSTMRLFSQLYW